MLAFVVIVALARYARRGWLSLLVPLVSGGLTFALVMLGEQREGPLPAPLIGASPVAIVPRLTPTEQRIVALVRKGYTNRQIADTNKVSVRTVEGHLYRIFAKLGVGRREDLREA